MGLGIDNMDDMHPGAGRVKHGRCALSPFLPVRATLSTSEGDRDVSARLCCGLAVNCGAVLPPCTEFCVAVLIPGSPRNTNTMHVHERAAAAAASAANPMRIVARVWAVGCSKSLRSLVTNKPKEANARSKPDSKEAALKELESVASALKRATTAVRRKAGAGEKDLEEALKAEGISKAQVPLRLRLPSLKAVKPVWQRATNADNTLCAGISSCLQFVGTVRVRETATRRRLNVSSHGWQVLSGVAARPHRSASIATHSAAARRQREALRERRASRSTAASDKDRGTARAVVHRRTQDEKRPRQTSHTHH
jgi:hypothetical protein